MKPGAGLFHSGWRSLHKEYFFYSDYPGPSGNVGVTRIIHTTMEIPKGKTRDEIKAREKNIKDFYAEWIACNPSKAVWNNSLNAEIKVIGMCALL